ncbi:hypothetical protein ACFLZV_00440 [Candidatus Margulisiibacteriota bacterium]
MDEKCGKFYDFEYHSSSSFKKFLKVLKNIKDGIQKNWKEEVISPNCLKSIRLRIWGVFFGFHNLDLRNFDNLKYVFIFYPKKNPIIIDCILPKNIEETRFIPTNDHLTHGLFNREQIYLTKLRTNFKSYNNLEKIIIDFCILKKDTLKKLFEYPNSIRHLTLIKHPSIECKTGIESKDLPNLERLEIRHQKYSGLTYKIDIPNHESVKHFILDLSYSKITGKNGVFNPQKNLRCLQYLELYLNGCKNIKDITLPNPSTFMKRIKMHLKESSIETINGLNKTNYPNLNELDINCYRCSNFKKLSNINDLPNSLERIKIDIRQTLVGEVADFSVLTNIDHFELLMTVPPGSTLPGFAFPKKARYIKMMLMPKDYLCAKYLDSKLFNFEKIRGLEVLYLKYSDYLSTIFETPTLKLSKTLVELNINFRDSQQTPLACLPKDSQLKKLKVDYSGITLTKFKKLDLSYLSFLTYFSIRFGILGDQKKLKTLNSLFLSPGLTHLSLYLLQSNINRIEKSVFKNLKNLRFFKICKDNLKGSIGDFVDIKILPKTLERLHFDFSKSDLKDLTGCDLTPLNNLVEYIIKLKECKKLINLKGHVLSESLKRIDVDLQSSSIKNLKGFNLKEFKGYSLFLNFNSCDKIKTLKHIKYPENHAINNVKIDLSLTNVSHENRSKYIEKFKRVKSSTYLRSFLG